MVDLEQEQTLAYQERLGNNKSLLKIILLYQETYLVFKDYTVETKKTPDHLKTYRNGHDLFEV